MSRCTKQLCKFYCKNKKNKKKKQKKQKKKQKKQQCTHSPEPKCMPITQVGQGRGNKRFLCGKQI